MFRKKNSIVDLHDITDIFWRQVLSLKKCSKQCVVGLCSLVLMMQSYPVAQGQLVPEASIATPQAVSSQAVSSQAVSSQVVPSQTASNPIVFNGSANFVGVDFPLTLIMYENQNGCPLLTQAQSPYGNQWLCGMTEINALQRNIRFIAEGEGVRMEALMVANGLQGNFVATSCDALACQDYQGAFLLSTAQQ